MPEGCRQYWRRHAQAALSTITPILRARFQAEVVAGDSGWIVGNGAGDQWRRWEQGMPGWTKDRDMATRYYSRADAEAVHAEDEDAWSVVPFETGAIQP
jgi:hypothetical protein